MLRIFKLLLAVGVMTLSGCGQVEWNLTNGEQKSIDDYRGRWLVINYWATWCKPCLEEIPELNLLNKRDDTEVLGVNFDELQGEELVSQAENLGIAYKMIADDPSKALDIQRPRALPATVLIDKKGGVREVLYGPQTVASILSRFALLE
ncbi:TlpA disulfide reductase family protein [Alkalimarinus sediminis]|uniref:TlpA family protein disulfide reductase n=1 Tax=Alkalimarinus sediminis TaxID=1632866 RepID=A0A9E8KQA9_9ALTE|nr:TlpA disulfide reductase family protein [Alkalimarinus sediminis]UZW75619.1 TlpA family protein disulfide reductase [Alkalimarinus sediminis]